MAMLDNLFPLVALSHTQATWILKLHSELF